MNESPDLIRYRLFLALSLFVVPFIAVSRLFRSKDTAETFFRRFFAENKSSGGVIWFHAASLGELNVLTVLLKEMRKHTREDFLVTTSNVVALAWAKENLVEDAGVTIAPLDYLFSLKRFFRIWSPKTLITIENEVFPNRIAFAKQRDIPIYFVNARMSDRSYSLWSKRFELSKQCFSKISYVWAQNAKSANFFEKLGTSQNRIATIPNLKRLVKPVSNKKPPTGFEPKKTFLAASTHLGEEEIVIEAFKRIRSKSPDVKLILVPRHPNRRSEILKLLEGLVVVLRSSGDPITKTTDVMLADTFHEMDLWYRMAHMTFIGGSLAPIGGHTPYEPIQFGTAILHGPHYENFASEYAALKSVTGAIECSNAAEISEAWEQLQNAKFHSNMTDAARSALGSTDAEQKQLKKIALHILRSVQ